jgi:amino acid adenylation domain-containing protein
LSEFMSTLSKTKQRLLELYLKEQRADSKMKTIAPKKESDPALLSFGQERLWFLDQMEPDSSVYNIPIGLRFGGPLNVPVLQRCLNEVLRRHESLRTGFKEVEGQLVQVIQPVTSLEMPLVDLRSLPKPERKAKARRLCTEEARCPFDLTRDLLLRARLFRLSEADHILLLNMHHIASDGWSVGVLARELSSLYEAFVEGRPSPLPDLSVQYVDFAVWQREWLQGDVLEKQIDYWRKQLEGAPTLLELPTDHPRPPVQTYRGALMQWEFPKPLLVALQDLSRREGATLFMTLLASFQTLLHRYTSSDEILVGSPIAGRNWTAIEPLIGFFVNTLVLRGDLSGNPSFRTFLGRTRAAALGAYAHQDVPFEKLVEELRPERNLSNSPFFQVMFVVQNSPWEAAELVDLEVTPMPIDDGTSKFDLTFFVEERGEALHAGVRYNTDLFEAETIRRMLGHYQTILEGIVANPDQRLSELPLLTSAERHQVLYGWNATAAPFPAERCIHELFEEQAAKTPDAVAVVFEDAEVSYGELNARANRLAHHLRGLGVKPDDRVAIAVERSIEMVVALLGTLKAGGAYVPLDPAYPQERLAFMLKDSAPVALLTQAAVLAKLGGILAGISVLALDAGEWAWRECSPLNPDPGAMGLTPSHLAYVIYTSGSTGTPKGVMVEHTNICNYLTWATGRYGGIGAVVSSSLSFDATATSLYIPLLSGHTVSLLQETTELDGLYERFLKHEGSGLIKITPSYLDALGQRLAAHRGFSAQSLLVVGGESLSSSTVELWRRLQPHLRMINEYGPTETAVGCVIYDIPSEQKASGPVPIGKPIANTRIYILDGGGEPVPVGVTGEIYIGGIGVARGYLNRPELTAERFLPDPFACEAGHAGARMYRTGDLGRWLPDGTIEFLGRNDHQVKIRGFRVEVGEIEARLLNYPGLREAVVLVREDHPGEKRLVAYVVGKADLSATTLRAHLASALPEYMVPPAYVRLEALPLTPNGKLDRKALPPPDVSAPEADAASLAPRTPTEEALARIWCEALNLSQPGLHENFFELGGHSLLAVRVIARINDTLKVRLGIPEFFLNPTIERLARVVEQKHHVRSEPRLVSLRPGHRGLPLYFMGAGIVEYQLAELIGGDHAIFAIDAPLPVDWHPIVPASDRAALPTIEQLSAVYSDVLRAHAGPSPCVVVGYSFFGKIAFEAASAVQAAGGKVACVLLIDAFAFSRKRRNLGAAWQSLLWIWRGAGAGTGSDSPYLVKLSASLCNFWRLLWWLLARIPYGVKRRVRAVKDRLQPAPLLSGHLDKEGMPIDWTVIELLGFLAGKAWHPRPLDASGALFRTKLPGEETLPGYDFTNGWGDLFARGVEIIQSSGNHLSMVSDENIGALARQIDAVLGRCSTDNGEADPQDLKRGMARELPTEESV